MPCYGITAPSPSLLLQRIHHYELATASPSLESLAGQGSVTARSLTSGKDPASAKYRVESTDLNTCINLDFKSLVLPWLWTEWRRDLTKFYEDETKIPEDRSRWATSGRFLFTPVTCLVFVDNHLVEDPPRALENLEITGIRNVPFRNHPDWGMWRYLPTFRSDGDCLPLI